MILVDTHYWLWLANEPQRLNSDVLSRLEQEGVALSAISCWELAMARSKGRVQLSMETGTWMNRTIVALGIELLPLTPKVGALACELPGEFHGDPADRIIVATAIAHNMLLLTADAKILAYPHVRVIR